MRDQISNTSRYLLAVENPRTSDELFDVMLDLAAHIGAERWVYIHAPPFGTDPERDPLGIAYHNFTRDFAERYAGSHLWDRAASIRTAMRTGEPFLVESGMDFIKEFGEHPTSPVSLETVKELAANRDR